MFFNIIGFLTFLSIITSTSMTQVCDNSICNFDAPCILDEDRKPTCKCIEQFSQGQFCSEPKDHCSTNPCQNGGTCTSYPGHFNCECASGYGGQNCSSQQNVFKGFHIHYNHIVPFGVEELIMIIFEDLGSVETQMEFFTEGYIIGGMIFNANSGHFKKSNMLGSVAKNLGIRHSDKLPYNTGFYKVSKASFWNLGTSSIQFDLNDFGPLEERLYSVSFDIMVYDPTGVNCIPILDLTRCSNPRKPLHLDIKTFDFIEPIVDKKCKPNSHLSISWSVRNYIGTVFLHKFPKQSEIFLTIPAYTMWFNYSDDFLQSYLIQGDVLEIDDSNNQIGKTKLRCYVFVDSKPTSAFILGGQNREVNWKKEFVLDGSISRDYARPSGRDQYLKYTWSCSSTDDATNPFCTQKMGYGSHLRIPAQKLQLDKTYDFSLSVKSSISVFSSDRTTQRIKTVSQDPLFIYFKCLRNCQHGKFTAGKLIHLKIKCLECPPGDISFSVRDKSGAEISNSERVFLTEKSKQEVYLKAEAHLGILSGGTSIELTQNQPPSGGTCSISPTDGIEFETLFKISCSGYFDEDHPIYYKFLLGNDVLDYSGGESLTTRLYRYAGDKCEIRIEICDDIGACTEFQLQATVKPIPKPADSWLELLTGNETNLKKLIAVSDSSAAFVLTESVISQLTADDFQEVTKHIVESFRNFEVKRILTAEKFLNLGHSLMGAINNDSKSALLISEMFLKVSDGFTHAIKNSEILELKVETHEMMMNDLGESMSKMAEEVEEFPPVQDNEPLPPEDPFSENYSDYGELNIDDVYHISNRLNSFERMHKCLQVMGVVSAFVQLPGESPIVMNKNGITSMTSKVDAPGAVPFTMSDSKTSIELPKEFLKSFGKSEITIQAIAFESNPLWWNPDQYKINTEVLSIGAYSKSLSSINSQDTKSTFNLYMQLKDSSDGHLTHGSIKSESEMLMFERVLPENSVLVVTFLPLDYDIQVILLMDDRPRKFMLDQAKAVPASSQNTTLHLVNDKAKKRDGFLAVFSKFAIDFSFTLSLKICTTWDSQALEWTSKYCAVGNQTNETHIHCSCWHLSLFGAKAYPTFGHVHMSENLVEKLKINYTMVATIFTLILLIFLPLGLAWWRDALAAENFVVVENINNESQVTFKYLVTIYTNGQSHAGTSSNVIIQLQGSLSSSPYYTLYSTTDRPVFYRNAQTSFCVFLGKDLGVLKSVSLQHDGFGRYPQWNCHMIKVKDEVRENLYIFMVNSWIYADSEEIVVPLARNDQLNTKSFIFISSIRNIFANFFSEQNFQSERVHGQFSAMEKTCVFIVKSCVTFMGTLIFFGPTTLLTYEEERETYYSMLLGFQKLFLIACFWHLVGVVLGEILYFFILKTKTGEENVKYNLVLRQ